MAAPRHAALAMACILAGPAVAATTSVAHTDRLTRTLAAPASLTLRATVGEIIVVGWARPDVRVEITRQAPSEERLTELPALVDGAAGHVAVAVVQRPGVNDATLRGSITAYVPFDRRLDAVELFEGRLTLHALRGGVRAHVERGDIHATALGGRIRLETVLGDVRLDRAELSDAGMVRIRTFNGDISVGFVSMPAHARILALALGGTVRSEVPLTLRTQFGPRFGETTLGRGAPVVSLDAVRGNIEITSGSG
jgi:hypothetical protein